MAKADQPEPVTLPTPAPKAEDASLDVASDLLTESLKRRKGRKASFLTQGQRSTTAKQNSLLGSSSSLGTK